MEQITFTITLTAAEHERLQAAAQTAGFVTIPAYLLALAYDPDPIIGFREAWQDVLDGNLLPLAALWQAFDDD